MRLIALASTVLAFTGCASLMKPSYVLNIKDQNALRGKAGSISNVSLQSDSVVFKFSNDTAKTSKIIWDESAIILLDGTAQKILPAGAKFIDATRSNPPAVLPAGASIDTSVVPVDKISFLSSGWVVSDIVPCVTKFGCDPKPQIGKSITLLLTVENEGKKHEYRVDAVLDENPELQRKPASPVN